MAKQPKSPNAALEPRLQGTVRLSAEGFAKVLGDLEARIMRAVWEIGRPAPAREVHEYVIREHEVALLTVVTVLNKLVAKRLLRRGKREGLLHYEARWSEEEFRTHVSRRMMEGILSFGPAASDKFDWFSSGNYEPVLTARGYMVLQPNYRGSTGYGDEFLRDMVGNYFNQAHKDVMAGVDHLIAEGMADPERLAKMGWSAGGHMTNKIITYTDRFKAASSGAGAINWLSMYGQSDTRIYRTPWFGGTPWQEDAPIEQYLANSPLTEIHKVTTPTLVLVGERDLRVPMPQSVELYRALKSNGVPTHLYIAEGQGHGWRELQQRLFKANVELDWFERWVRNSEYTWEESPVRETETTAEAEDEVSSRPQ